MTQATIAKKLISSQPVYMGIDVHKKSWSVCLIHQEEVLMTVTIPSNIKALEKLLHRYSSHTIYSVYEAGFSGFTLHYQLTERGIKSIIVSPRKIPIEVGNLVKTDKRDAQKLAFSLSRGLIRGNYIPTKEEVAIRQLIRSREVFKRKRTRAIQQLKMLLLQYDIQLSHGLTRKTRIQLVGLELPEAIRFTVDSLVEEADFFRMKMREFEKRAHQVCQEPKYYQRYQIVQSVPGMGPVIAAALCFEIGDFGRFSTGKKLCAYLGLTPRECSSGERVWRGRITGQGNPWLRSYLIEAAWKTIAKDPVLRESYERIRRNTTSAKKAIVAIARKICLRLHSLMIRKECYAIGVVA
jgi:transposase